MIRKIMLNLLAYFSLISTLLCKDLILNVKINSLSGTRVFCNFSHGVYLPVETTTELLGVGDGFATYRATISLFKEPTLEDMNHLEILIIDESVSHPNRAFFSVFRWPEIKDNQIKIFLTRGTFLFPIKYNVRERLLYIIKSQNGYHRNDICFADENGQCWIRWEATFGESVVRVRRGKEPEADEEVEYTWDEWKFEPSPDLRMEPKFIKVSAK